MNKVTPCCIELLHIDVPTDDAATATTVLLLLRVLLCVAVS
jgi:hypothetical protein